MPYVSCPKCGSNLHISQVDELGCVSCPRCTTVLTMESSPRAGGQYPAASANWRAWAVTLGLFLSGLVTVALVLCFTRLIPDRAVAPAGVSPSVKATSAPSPQAHPGLISRDELNEALGGAASAPSLQANANPTPATQAQGSPFAMSESQLSGISPEDALRRGEQANTKGDLAVAAFWFRRAALNGKPKDDGVRFHAVTSLFNFCSQPESGVTLKDFYKVLSAVAEEGDPASQYCLWKAYSLGLLSKDEAKPHLWTSEEVMSGKLAESPALWLLRYAQQETSQPELREAQCEIGKLFLDGKEVRRDIPKAMAWFTKSANSGDADAMVYLGELLGKGGEAFGVKTDGPAAVKWLRQASELGNVAGSRDLAFAYYDGVIVTKDFAQSIPLFRKAAEKGDSVAMFQLGVMYYRGEGVTQSFDDAAQWCKVSANRGFPRAQLVLGLLYEGGRGVLESKSAAAEWIHRAGMSHLQLGQRDEALACYDSLMKIAPGSPLAVDLRAALDAAKTQLGEFNRAIEATVFGTAFPMASGQVVTCQHVIFGAKRITLIRTDGTKISAQVVASDAANDLAVLSVKDVQTLPMAVPLGTEAVSSGERVFTVGYPHPDIMGIKPKTTDGIVNAITGVKDDPRVFQFSAPLQGGNSGGPVFNMRGEVVGVAVSKLNAVGVFRATGDLPENVNYGIKISYVRALLESQKGGQQTVKTTIAKEAELKDLVARVQASALLVQAER